MTKSKLKKVNYKSNKSPLIGQKFYIPLSFIVILLAITLLQVNWMPFLGWVYVLMAFASGLASLVKNKEKKFGKLGTATLALGLSVIVLLILVLSLPIINVASFKTYLDVKVLLFYLF